MNTGEAVMRPLKAGDSNTEYGPAHRDHRHSSFTDAGHCAIRLDCLLAITVAGPDLDNHVYSDTRSY